MYLNQGKQVKLREKADFNNLNKFKKKVYIMNIKFSSFLKFSKRYGLLLAVFILR